MPSILTCQRLWGRQFLACLLLFTFANLLACLCANLLQGRFNKATQAKLTEALRKARPLAGS